LPQPPDRSANSVFVTLTETPIKISMCISVKFDNRFRNIPFKKHFKNQQQNV